MTSRERVLKTLNHQLPDRVPISDEVWRSTSKRWHEQGYPWTNWVGREIDDGYFEFDFSFFEFLCGPLFQDNRVNHRKSEFQAFLLPDGVGKKIRHIQLTYVEPAARITSE